MKNNKCIVFLLILETICMCILFVSVFWKEPSDSVLRKLNNINLKGVDKLMIVAHPDDELLWGGSHLLEDTYLVVCVTCGEDEVRQREFVRAMKIVDCPYISLGYPDRNTWESYEKFIKNDFDTILNYKRFNYIVTHNPDGEYGHSQHIKVSKYVTFLAPHDKLYYFDHYYTQEELDAMDYEKKGLSKKKLNKKIKALEVYVSQEAIVNNHKATTPYEEFIPYETWYEEVENNS